MLRQTLIGLALLIGAALPATAGGGGPVSVKRVHGTVAIREINGYTGRPTGPWRSARPGELSGSYLVRTGRGSFARLDLPFSIRKNGRWRYVGPACLDSGSLVRIDSYADSEVRVLRGRISPADGKRSGRLPNRMG